MYHGRTSSPRSSSGRRSCRRGVKQSQPLSADRGGRRRLRPVVRHQRLPGATGYPNAAWGRPVIGKTGTLGNGDFASEAWFIGAIPQYSLAVVAVHQHAERRTWTSCRLRRDHRRSAAVPGRPRSGTPSWRPSSRTCPSSRCRRRTTPASPRGIQVTGLTAPAPSCRRPGTARPPTQPHPAHADLHSAARPGLRSRRRDLARPRPRTAARRPPADVYRGARPAVAAVLTRRASTATLTAALFSTPAADATSEQRPKIRGCAGDRSDLAQATS